MRRKKLLENAPDTQKDIESFFRSWSDEEIKKLKNPEQLGKLENIVAIAQ